MYFLRNVSQLVIRELLSVGFLVFASLQNVYFAVAGKITLLHLN